MSVLADNAMEIVCVMQIERLSALTVSLSVDFLSGGRVGQWLEVRAVPARLSRPLASAHARIGADGEMIAKDAATFRIVEVPADGAWSGRSDFEGAMLISSNSPCCSYQRDHGSISNALWRLSAKADVHPADRERPALGRGLPLPSGKSYGSFSPLAR